MSDLNKQISEDLERYFIERVQRLICDYAERLEETGLPRKKIMAFIIASMMKMTIELIAEGTSMPPEKVGQLVSDVITEYRERAGID